MRFWGLKGNGLWSLALAFGLLTACGPAADKGATPPAEPATQVGPVDTAPRDGAAPAETPTEEAAPSDSEGTPDEAAPTEESGQDDGMVQEGTDSDDKTEPEQDSTED